MRAWRGSAALVNDAGLAWRYAASREWIRTGWGEAIQGRGGPGAARAKRAFWARPVHARQPFDTMPEGYRMLLRTWESAGSC